VPAGVAKPIPPKMIGLIAAAVVVLGVVGWLVFGPKGSETPGPVAPVASSVAIDIRPWAKIEAITRKSDGKAVEIGELTTPCVIPLEPGEYHVRASNPFFPQQPLEFDLTVTGRGDTVVKSLPGLSPDDEARKILEGR
jgi:hypothetical protein